MNNHNAIKHLRFYELINRALPGIDDDIARASKQCSANKGAKETPGCKRAIIYYKYDSDFVVLFQSKLGTILLYIFLSFGYFNNAIMDGG